MREVTPVEKLIYEKESDSIGGMIVNVWGEQGAGKTMTLVKMVMKDMGIDNSYESGKKFTEFNKDSVRRIPLWKGQENCQWIILAANDMPVTLWMHETVLDYQFYLTGSKKNGLDKRKLEPEDMPGMDVQVKTYSSQEELVERLDGNRVNVYYIPGAKGGQKDKYFYQRQNYELDRALNNRDFGDHVTVTRDEISNEASTMRKGDFYELQEFLLPQEWEDFRKNKISMRGAGHSTTDVNYKLHKVKATGTVYMQGAKVHSRHTEVRQDLVNDMRRGQFVIPGFQPGEVDPMPRLPNKVFDWMPDTNDIRLRVDIESDIPDIRPEEKEVDEWIEDQPFSKSDMDDMMTLKQAEEFTDLGRTALKNRIYKGEVQAIKLEDKHWILSATQLLNNSKVPIDD